MDSSPKNEKFHTMTVIEWTIMVFLNIFFCFPQKKKKREKRREEQLVEYNKVTFSFQCYDFIDSTWSSRQ